jgi:DNA-binding transcriptional ArsR family regulator
VARPHLRAAVPQTISNDPAARSPWSGQLVDLVASRLALLGDPTRVQLLTTLEQGERSLQQLSENMASTPQNVSRHLCILHRAGIVVRRRDGNATLYSLADYSACRLLEQVLESIRGQLEELADLVKLAA